MTTKTLKRREFILHGNLFKVIMMITAPLAMYAVFNYLYGIIDLALVPTITAKATVVFYDEMKNAISAFGAGIATAGSVIVGRLYGANKIDEARKHAGQTFWLNLLVCSLVGILVFIFSQVFFVAVGTPSDILEGLPYFYIQVVTTIVMSVTTTFVGMEKVKGNTLLVFILNVAAMAIKILLSVFFIKVLNLSEVFAALSTLISQVMLMGVSLYLLFRKSNILKVKLSDIKLQKTVFLPILILAIPIFIGKFLFSIGKVIVSIVAASHYSSDVISAFGVMSKIASVFGNLAMTFEEGQSSIISINIGSKQLKRAMLSYPISIGIAALIGIAGVIFSSIYSHFFMSLFINFETDSKEYIEMVYNMFLYERWSTITNALIGITVAAFIGFKKSFMSTIINIARLFVFRIPILLICVFAFKMNYI
ncbi:MAG: hypothetical protein LBV51_04550, partial [Acholeplasmatales bacterium]|nr:hypothetical protein [Acholeplasmatales bacterium]